MNREHSNTADYSNCASPGRIPTTLHQLNYWLFEPLLSELSNSISGPLISHPIIWTIVVIKLITSKQLIAPSQSDWFLSIKCTLVNSKTQISQTNFTYLSVFEFLSFYCIMQSSCTRKNQLLMWLVSKSVLLYTVDQLIADSPIKSGFLSTSVWVCCFSIQICKDRGILHCI